MSDTSNLIHVEEPDAEILPAKKLEAAPIMPKEKGLPEGMGARLFTMLIYTIALGFTGFGNILEFAYVPFFAWLGVGLSIGMFLLWRDRTLPRPTGFWILMGIVWFAFVLIPIRPYLGLVATVPVALLWLHDSPATPSVMITWGLLATLQQNPAVWSAADEGTAFYVILAMILVIGAAQLERERLARRYYSATSPLWMFSRLGAVLLWSLVMLGARESLGAMSFFTYLGFDLSGIEGKVTVITIMLLSLAAAAMLLRVRPYKYADPYQQPRDKQGRRVARQSTIAPNQFDEPAKRVTATKTVKGARAGGRTTTQPVKAVKAVKTVKAAKVPKSAARPAPRGALKPGEIDFD